MRDRGPVHEWTEEVEVTLKLLVDSGLVAESQFYMAAEHDYAKFKDTFDGTNKTFKDFQFAIANQRTCTAMAGKGEAGRQASSAIMTIIEERGNDNRGVEELSLHGYGLREESATMC